jgi:serine/threonine protein phosphatase PrpC
MKNGGTLFATSFHSLFIESINQPRGEARQSEDYALVAEGLLGIFDSVGGCDHGLLVSALAGQAITTRWQALSQAKRQGSPEQLETILQTLLRHADAVIAGLPLPPEQRRPATTAALYAFSLISEQAWVSIAHLGDSRVYLLREGQPLQRLTQDHSYFSFAVRRQKLTEEEARRIEQAERADDLSLTEQTLFARRREITCAVGWSDFSQIPTSSHLLLPGDGLLLCSDGIHDNLTDREIEAVLCEARESGAGRLVSAASERSQQAHFRAKPDDMSAIVA